MIESFFQNPDNKLETIRLFAPKEAKIYFHKKAYDLLNSCWTQESIEDFNGEIKKINLKSDSKTVIHFFYEYGNALLDIERESVSDDEMLAVFIKYGSDEKVSLKSKKICSQGVLQLIDAPDFNRYKEAFDIGTNHLYNGDCYQFNLTFPFTFELRQFSPTDLYAAMVEDTEKLGEYAMLTNLNEFGYLLSNSPECLFKLEENKLVTMPIKGTRSVKDFESSDLAWEDLFHSKKDQAELYMITDLLRNDLNRISPYANVEFKKVRLDVNELVHQYSKISLELKKLDLSLFDIMSSLFPGGSITGAPKKRVMKILNSIEHSSRQFYCGSTFLNYGKVKSASINIRSAMIDATATNLTYHAGGGITVKSSVEGEYEEMLSKVQSFTGLFNPEPCSPLNKKTNNISALNI